VVVSGIATSDVSSEVTVKIDNVRNPPNSNTLLGFSFEIMDQGNNIYEIYNGGSLVGVTVNIPGDMTNVQSFVLDTSVVA
jgi:hypothetical protein